MQRLVLQILFALLKKRNFASAMFCHIFCHFSFLKSNVKIFSCLIFVNPISCIISSRELSVLSHYLFYTNNRKNTMVLHL